jgi:CDP-2,3-bis-(O-geranylgeranyl)-sn-glycerol synthase
MQIALIFKVLALIVVANGAPIVAKRILGASYAAPIDGGMIARDGRRLLGPTKTVRGLAAALAATALCAPLLGIDAIAGLLLAAAAMAGDFFSSFVKRRQGKAPSSKSTGPDQVPESLLPALLAMPLLGLSAIDVVLVTLLFTAGNMLASKLLFRLNLRDRPH